MIPTREVTVVAITRPTQDLTDEEAKVFERLAKQYEDDDVGRICQAVLQSSETNEEANS